MAKRRKKQIRYILVPVVVNKHECECGYKFTIFALIDVAQGDENVHLEHVPQRAKFCPCCGGEDITISGEIVGEG